MAARVYRFGGFDLHPDRRRLARDGAAVRLGSRAFDLLLHLVLHRDRVLSRDELLDHVWPGIAVEEANLSVHMSALRKVLGPDAVSTIPGRGYRFVAPVVVDGPDAAPAPEPAPAAAVPLPSHPSLAVLPFATHGDDAEQELFAIGLVEDLVTTLSRIAGLTVIAPASTLGSRRPEADPRQVGRDLGVATVLEGSVRHHAGRTRITARLVDAASGAQLWAERYDRAIDDVFALQDELALMLVTELQVHLTDGEQARLRHSGIGSFEAWSWWARGLACYRRANLTREGMLPALMAWQKAAALDPGSATVHAMLGMLYYLDARFDFWNDRPAAVARGGEHAGRALALDPACSDAHMARGLLLLLEGRHGEAVEAARRSVAHGPQSADAAAFAAFVLANAGLGGEAVVQIERAVRLCPMFPPYYWGHMGLAYRVAGRTGDAIAAFTRYQEANPGRGVTDLVAIHARRGAMDEARAWAGRLLAAFPGFRIGSWRDTQFRSDADDLEADVEALRAAGLPD